MLPLILLVVGVLAQQTFAEEPEAIVGGTLAAPGEFPHQCSLRVSGSHICGGSIISPDTILTAAHCVHGIVSAPYNNFKVATGTTSVSGGQLHTVRTVHVHPGYKDSVNYAWVNDIAVIKLAAPIQYNQYQSPIALTNFAPVPGQTCTLSGWGQISTNGPLARELLKMNQKLISLQQCKQSHGGMPLTESHLCSFNTRGIGACSGDSGGPLICDGKQYGVTSWVLPCALGKPDAYTNVYHHRSFIRQYL